MASRGEALARLHATHKIMHCWDHNHDRALNTARVSFRVAASASIMYNFRVIGPVGVVCSAVGLSTYALEMSAMYLEK